LEVVLWTKATVDTGVPGAPEFMLRERHNFDKAVDRGEKVANLLEVVEPLEPAKDESLFLMSLPFINLPKLAEVGALYHTHAFLFVLCGFVISVFPSALHLFPAKLGKAFELFRRPLEFFFLLKFLLSYKTAKIPKGLSPAENYCYNVLTKVSRSFSAVILELSQELRDPICIFYLVLRALDTVEDDMSIPLEKKIKLLKEFANHLEEPGWNSREGYGASNVHEMKLLENFDQVIEVYSKLKPCYQVVIKDITIRMADGMCHFAQNKVVNMDDYNLYCHYVAGLVGIGLSKLWNNSGLEGDRFADLDELSNSMGLFLQKTNITRDYLEDIMEAPPRVFYPKDIWGKYASNVDEFKYPQNREQALKCLNEMVTNAVGHLTDCLDYMDLVKEPSIFKFCAIPQVMAIAPLERCYNNPAVFTSEVKIRKGEAVRLMMGTNTYEDVCWWFDHYIDLLDARVPAADPNAQNLKAALAVAKKKIQAIRLAA